MLEAQGYRIAIDPYADYVPGYHPLAIDAMGLDAAMIPVGGYIPLMQKRHGRSQIH